MQLHKEARRMLFHLDRQGFRIHVRFGLFDCNSAGEDVLLNVKSQSTKHESGSTKHESGSTKHESGSTSPESQSTNPESFANNAAVSSASAEVSSAPPPSDIFRLSFLRQQTSPYLCLADFLRPRNPEGQHDRIGIFCTAADESIEHLYEEGTADADTYRHLLCQTLADRLAEAATERAHQAIRKHYWGYAPAEALSIHDLLAERFQGIRPAVGYPSLPDQSLNFDLDRLIDFSTIGIRLTEVGAMRPHASVSGLMIAHPEAHYFAVGSIGEDQLLDYALRKGRTPEEMRPYLASNLR